MSALRTLAIWGMFTSMAVAQASPPGQSPSGAAQTPAPHAGASTRSATNATDAAELAHQEAVSRAVPPTAPVITVNGLCASKPAASSTAKAGTAAQKPAAACKTVVTKKQWEDLVKTVRPNLPATAQRPLAQEYVAFLTLADAGRNAGLEQDPEVREKLRLSRMQILASAYTQKLQKKYADVPASEIDAYYKQNSKQFEEVTLKRIYVPKPAAAEGKPPDDAASKTLAEKIRERAAAGEDFEKLQKEAFEGTSNKGTPPPTSLGGKRHGTLPPKQEEAIFNLKPGEVSPVYEEASGFFIYKVESKGTAPLNDVKPEIQRILETEKLRSALEKLKGSVRPAFNDQYFGPPPSESSHNQMTPPEHPGGAPAGAVHSPAGSGNMGNGSSATNAQGNPPAPSK
jgi:hypothetical protein